MFLFLIILLLAALLPLPYGYYILLRFFVCFGVLRELFIAPSDNIDIALVFIAIALLYNPIVKMPLGRPIWTVVNILTALYFAYYLLALKGNKNNN